MKRASTSISYWIGIRISLKVVSTTALECVGYAVVAVQEKGAEAAMEDVAQTGAEAKMQMTDQKVQ
jgi:hypothetical protein